MQVNDENGKMSDGFLIHCAGKGAHSTEFYHRYVIHLLSHFFTMRADEVEQILLSAIVAALICATSHFLGDELSMHSPILFPIFG